MCMKLHSPNQPLTTLPILVFYVTKIMIIIIVIIRNNDIDNNNHNNNYHNNDNDNKHAYAGQTE
jgi:hypothetical protein